MAQPNGCQSLNFTLLLSLHIPKPYQTLSRTLEKSGFRRYKIYSDTYFVFYNICAIFTQNPIPTQSRPLHSILS